MAGKTRASALTIAPTAILLIASASLIFVSSQRLRANRDLVVHTYSVISAARQFLLAAEDAEAGQRGYLITGRPAFLEPYRSAVARIPALEARLREATIDNPDQQQRLDTLAGLVNKKRAELASTIETMDTSGPDAARQLVMNDVGREAMEGIRRIIGDIIVEEQALLQQRVSEADETEWRTLMVAIATMIAALVALAVAQMALVRRNAQLARAEGDAALKAGLLQATLDHTPEGIVAFDPHGTLHAFNRHFFEHLDLPASLAAEGISLDALLAADAARDPPVLQSARARANSPAAGDDVMFQGRIGHRVVEIGAHPTADGGLLLSTLDVTRRAQAEEVATQAQKMEAIGQLTGGLAHDFNNLLQIINGNLDLLVPQVKDNPQALRRLRNAMAGATHGAQLTRRLLAFARRQPLEPRAVNLGRMIGEMTELLRQTLGEQIEIETIVGGGLWNTLADPTQIENAVLNLAINARDAMPDGGKLTVELANASLDEEYAARHAEVSPGQYVMLAVTDTGLGMAPDVMERAFEPFFTTKSESRGTGLGLSQVYGFVRQTGGHIKIYSEIGKGTTVKIYLPRTKQEQDWTGSASLAPEVGGNETVLVVEDDAEVRHGAIDVLTSLGYRVIEAAGTEQALEILSRGTPIDLLFTDVVMPGTLKTTELAMRAKQLQPGIAVLYTSGYTENAIIHNGEVDTQAQLLSKPYGRDELARKLRLALAGAEKKEKSPAGTAGTAPAAAPPVPPNEPATRKPDDHRLRLLVVEDNAIVRASTIDMLAELGYDIEEAGSAREALQKLDGGGTIDVLLTDIGLPDMKGEDLAAECLRQRPGLPIIFVTGMDSKSTSGSAATLSATMLEKPFMAADIKCAIDAALARATKAGSVS